MGIFELFETFRMAKNRTKGSAVVSIALVAALICWLMTPLLPQMVKAVMPLPSLESIHPIEGRLEYEGEWAPRRVPRYFVRSEEGRHEFYCGYLGGRHSCFAKPAVLAGQRTKVWHSYAFGAVRIDVDPIPGQRVHPLDTEAHTFEGARANYRDPEYVRPQNFNSFGIFFLLALEVWLVWRVMNDRRGMSQQRKRSCKCRRQQDWLWSMRDAQHQQRPTWLETQSRALHATVVKGTNHA